MFKLCPICKHPANVHDEREGKIVCTKCFSGSAIVTIGAQQFLAKLEPICWDTLDHNNEMEWLDE